VPEGVSLRQAAFAALGCIAMQGIRRLELTPGERIGVIGLGLIGQICVRLLVAMGYQAFGTDVDGRRVAKALEVSGVEAWTIGQADVVRLVRQRTSGQGLDGVVLCAATAGDEPVHLACDLCRPRGRISVVGDVGLGLARAKMYKKELELRLSCSYGPGRCDPAYELAGQDYPVGHVRWTEGRNLELFLRLLETGRLDLESLVSACVPVADAPAAYAKIKQGDSSVFGVLLDYGPLGEPAVPVARTLRVVRNGDATRKPADGRIGLGVIGVGGYAKAVDLPNLRRLAARFEVRGLASRSGVTAATAARRLGIPLATSDYHELLADPAIEAVLVATRHAAHAGIVLDALEAGKHVFVEKPMTTGVEDGEAIVAKAAATGLVVRVGFNRRFAPHLLAMREAVGRQGVRMLSVRVNVGTLGDDWSNTPEEGGRLLGEGVHFFDLCNWFFAAEPESLSAVMAGSPAATNPDAAILLGYPGGSTAQILYTTLGHRGLGKEYYEALGNGRSVRCDDFRTLAAHGAAVSVRRRDRGDKGQLRALEEFAFAIRNERYPFVGADAAAGLLATRLALAVPQSAGRRQSIRLAA
jgi:predicted dehydrogenase